MKANKNARLHEMQTKIVDSNEANSSAKEKSAPRSETMATSHHLLPNIENGRNDLPTTCKADIFFLKWPLRLFGVKVFWSEKCWV